MSISYGDLGDDHTPVTDTVVTDTINVTGYEWIKEQTMRVVLASLPTSAATIWQLKDQYGTVLGRARVTPDGRIITDGVAPQFDLEIKTGVKE